MSKAALTDLARPAEPSRRLEPPGLPGTRPRPGTAGVEGGRLTVVDPEDGGEPARLIPTRLVSLTVNGTLVSAPVRVTSRDVVSVVPAVPEDAWRFRVDVAKDAMTVSLRVNPRPGHAYRLADAPPAPTLILKVERAEGEPDPVTVEEVVQHVRAQGVVAALDEEAIASALEAPTGEPVVIAAGTPPTDGQPGRVEALFAQEPQIVGPQILADGRADYRTTRQIPSVEVGTTIAVVHEPVMGVDGTDVLGRTVPAKVPRRARVVVGSGALLSEDDKKVFAAIAGRPLYQGRPEHLTVKVIALHFHDGDVDLASGNIQFKGDVVVTGSVQEQMRVSAEGSVKILGGVSRATVEAGQTVEIGGIAANSRIVGGGALGVYTRLQPIVEDLVQQLERLRATVEFLLAHPSFRRIDIEQVGVGRLVRLLLDGNLRGLPKLVLEFVNCIREVTEIVDPEVADLTRRLATAFSGPDLPKLRTVADLAELVAAARRAQFVLEVVGLEVARVRVGGAMHSVIACSGSVEVGPKGTYFSEVTANGSVRVQGRIAGGAVYGRTGITAAEAGTPMGAQTELRTGPEASIEVREIHPGVVLRVGSAARRLDVDLRGLRARLDRQGTIQLFGVD